MQGGSGISWAGSDGWEIAANEKEVQDASCRGSGGVPQIYKVTQDCVTRGLIQTISAVAIRMVECRGRGYGVLNRGNIGRLRGDHREL